MAKKHRRREDDTGDSEIMLQTLENEVAQTKDIMKNNIVKMHERHGKLDDLESRADILAEQTTLEFKKLAVKTKEQAKRKSRRFTYILAAIIVVSTLIIILIIVLYATGVLGEASS